MTTFIEALKSFDQNFVTETVLKDSATNTAGSTLGAWINLAVLRLSSAKAFTAEETETVNRLLGGDREQVQEWLKNIFAESPELLKLAVGFWLNSNAIETPLYKQLVKVLKEVDPQATYTHNIDKQELDEWTKEKSLGLIPKFPVDKVILENLESVLANVVATKIKWNKPYSTETNVDSGWGVEKLLLAPKTTARVGVTADGNPYVVHWKFSETAEGETPILVANIVGSEQAGTTELYNTLLNLVQEGNLKVNTFDEAKQFVAEHPDLDFLVATKLPAVAPTVVYNVSLPAWEASQTNSLDSLESYKYLANLLELDATTFQTTKTKYGKEGYEAASLTATLIKGASAFAPAPRNNEQITFDVNFTRPFVSVAFVDTQTGVLSGVPLFTNVVKEGTKVED